MSCFNAVATWESCNRTSRFHEKNSGHCEYDSYQCKGAGNKSLETYQVLGVKRGKLANRNLLIRSLVWDVVNRTTVIPAQALQEKMKCIQQLNKTKVVSSTLNRRNPDTKAGLYCNESIIKEAYIVQQNKILVKEKEAVSKQNTMRKHVEARKRREEVYLTFTEKVLAQGNGVIPKMTKTILEDVFIFLGRKEEGLK